jgi:hypothetical protein
LSKTRKLRTEMDHLMDTPSPYSWSILSLIPIYGPWSSFIPVSISTDWPVSSPNWKYNLVWQLVIFYANVPSQDFDNRIEPWIPDLHAQMWIRLFSVAELQLEKQSLTLHTFFRHSVFAIIRCCCKQGCS